MNKTMDTLFVRAGSPLRLHFDDTRITAAAIRQLSWRVEQGGGTIVDHHSKADILVVDPAAPWVFHDFLRTKRIELRPSVVLAFWIPLCLTTRSLVWITHPCWQQVVVPSERPPHSEIPQGVTAYSSFLAGIAYSKMSLLSSRKPAPRSSIALERDSSIISYVDNSDLEVSQSLEPGASSDDEPLGYAHRPQRSVPRMRPKPSSNSPSAAASPRRITEGQGDEAEVSDILPVGDATLPPDDVEMSPPSPELVQPPEKSVVKSAALSNSTGSAKKRPPTVPDLSDAQRHTSSRHSSLQSENGIPRDDSHPVSATVAVEPEISSKPRSVSPAIKNRSSTAPQHVETKPASSVGLGAAAVGAGGYIPTNLDSTPPPPSEEPNSPTVVLDKPKAPSPPSASNRPSTTGSDPAIVSDTLNAINGPQRTQGQSSIETDASSKPAELATSAATTPTETSSSSKTIKPQASTSSDPPNTPASVPKALVLTSSTGLRRVLDPSFGTHSSKPSPSNAVKAKVRPKMRPKPQPDGNDSVLSGLPQPKSKLKIQSGANGMGTKLRPSMVASTTGGAPLIKPSQSSTATTTTTASVDSPDSTSSSPVINATISLPASATTTPATTVAADTPNPVPGSSLSRPKKLIIRSPTNSAVTLSRPSASVSPVQSRRTASTSASRTHPPSPEDTDPFNSPPPPPTPTPEQLASLAAKRPAWTKEEDQYIIDYMNWVFAQDPFASTSEIMREIATNCPYRSVSNWQNRFTSKEDSIYMNEVPVLFERLTNRTSGVSSGASNNKTLQILSGTRTRSRRAIDYVNSSGDENGDSSVDGDGPPRKRSRRSRASARRRSDRL
ncbi:unnamed protein product [Rhizoctonia solani]|uniref:Myb-like domain-containing protein n=1 Tax=Rhizoctonia solani TaxID=456999 RepID=A0A8H2XVK3_9AGAM|nr:unnamed protein product [Rhizoctonia solani]